MPLLEGGNIANIERIMIVTIEETPATYVFETATDAGFQPSLSAGQEQIQRVKNAIMGLIKTEDLVLGYELTFDDQRLIPQILALVDGGTLTLGAGDDWLKYEAPAAGTPVSRKAFDMTLYTSDRDSDAEALAYHAWKFPNCKGSPLKGTFKDNNFATLQYGIKNRVAKGVIPMTVDKIAELPAVA